MKLKDLEFDLLYLALLTRERVKPLSRWEKELRPGELKALKSMGLKTGSVERRLESGQRVEELVFSTRQQPIKVYTHIFKSKPIDNSLLTVLAEGELFGYPECCVHSFASKGYLPNGLPEDDQRLLFHWACPGCQVTSELLPRYRSAYEEARRLQRQYASKKHMTTGRLAGMIPSLGLASCLLFSGCLRKSTTSTQPPNQELDIGSITIEENTETSSQVPDIHWIPLEQDSDEDYLKDEWEGHFGLQPTQHDTDGNGVPDGPQLASHMWDVIHNPPEWIQVHQAYERGLVRCAKCGKAVNMGWVLLTNTNKNDTIWIRYLSLHYMEHGSFAFEAEGGYGGVVNPVELDSLLSE